MSEELADHDERLAEVVNESTHASKDMNDDIFYVKCADEGTPINEEPGVV